MPRFVITGAPGTGKTTVIALLAHRFSTVAEPARSLIAEHAAAPAETTLDGRPELFVQRLLGRSIEDFHSVSDAKIVLFDRGLPDCVAYAAALGVDVDPVLQQVEAAAIRYQPKVFVAPPWKQIYTTDGCGEPP